METITTKQLKAYKRNAYAISIKNHLLYVMKYHGLDEMKRQKQNLIKNGYDVKKDYYIMMNHCLTPVKVLEV